MYDARIGRWLSQDPIGFQAGDANLYRYVGNDSTNAMDPSGLKEVKPGDLPGNPDPQLFVDLPIIAFEFERSLLPRVLPDTIVVPNPMFQDLLAIKKMVDGGVLSVIKTNRILKKRVAVWATVDAGVNVQADVDVHGSLSELYKSRAERELTKQADAFAQIVKSQLFPRYYLSEKEDGCVKANAGKLVWTKDKDTSKAFEDLVRQVAAKQLSVERTITVLNPFMILGAAEGRYAKLTFKARTNIRVSVYYATLEK